MKINIINEIVIYCNKDRATLINVTKSLRNTKEVIKNARDKGCCIKKEVVQTALLYNGVTKYTNHDIVYIMDNSKALCKNFNKEEIDIIQNLAKNPADVPVVESITIEAKVKEVIKITREYHVKNDFCPTERSVFDNVYSHIQRIYTSISKRNISDKHSTYADKLKHVLSDITIFKKYYYGSIY